MRYPSLLVNMRYCDGFDGSVKLLLRDIYICDIHNELNNKSERLIGTKNGKYMIFQPKERKKILQALSSKTVIYPSRLTYTFAKKLFHLGRRFNTIFPENVPLQVI